MADRITEIRIQGLRSLADVRLKLDGLTVLIGENGSGKSTIIEALELLRKAAQVDFLGGLGRSHGGLSNLLRGGVTRLQLTVRIEGTPDDEGNAGDRLEYDFVVAQEGAGYLIEAERLIADVPFQDDRVVRPIWILDRTRSATGFLPAGRNFGVARDPSDRAEARELQTPMMDRVSVRPEDLAVAALASLPPHNAIGRVCQALRSIDVRPAINSRAFWVGREEGTRSPLREPSTLLPVTSFSRLGDNLASCFHSLRNQRPADHWRETMDLVRLGLGEEVRSVNVILSPSGGEGALSLEVERLPQQVPASAISDGALAYLAFVAMTRVGEGERSLLAIDEPETHLHPHLLVRVLGMLEDVAEHCPVVLATHSDRLLDALPDPAANVVLCRLNQRHETELVRPNPEAFQRWLEHYRGIGDMRSEGVDDLVITDPH